MLVKLIKRIRKIWYYCAEEVWNDTRPTLTVNLVKTVNLTVRSFFNSRAQVQACALTYRTILAVVPALAILFAIGRGFGLQNVLEDELYRLFPGQNTGINQVLTFVDRTLGHSSEGIFLGVGIAFLLWTVISLIGNIEATFNTIWGVRQGRSIWRKITDYTAIILILPVLMICGGGLSMSLSETLRQLVGWAPVLSPLTTVLFELGSYLFATLFFMALFMLVPNTKVKFKPALIAGAITAVAFMILQWIFVSGQTYVARYNAIYGSFSFIPLFLLWMQFVWVICISGSLICYASQNIFRFSFIDQIDNISRDYKEKVTVAIAAAVVQEFVAGRTPITNANLIKSYGIPSKLVVEVTENLCELGIFSRVIINTKTEEYGFQPAQDPSTLTLNYLRSKINRAGCGGFIPSFDTNFSGVVSTLDAMNAAIKQSAEDILLSKIKLRLPLDQETTNLNNNLQK